MTAADHRKAMRRLLEGFTPRHRMWETFDAWTEAAYRQLARQHHPDRGGDPTRMAGINAAIAQARRELGG